MNSKVKKIKKLIKKERIFPLYKKSLINKKVFFILTKISYIFESSINDLDLLKLESNLANDINNIQNWEEVFEQCSHYFSDPFKRCDWKSFGIFFYYQWGIITFDKNIKKNKSFYNYDNFNQLNEKKTFNYDKWINSMLDTKKSDFNLYIRRVLNLL